MKIEELVALSNFADSFWMFEQFVFLCSYFIWGASFYLLWKKYPLNFLVVLIVAEVSGIISWLWINRHLFGNFMSVSKSSTNADIACIAIVDLILTSTPLFIGTAGAVMALKYLLEKRNKYQSAILQKS